MLPGRKSDFRTGRDAKRATMSFYVLQFGDLSRYGCVLGPFVIDGLFLPPFVIVGCGRGF